MPSRRQLLASLGGLTTLSGCLGGGCDGVVNPLDPAGTWSMADRTAARAGYAPDASPPNQPARRWCASLGPGRTNLDQEPSRYVTGPPVVASDVEQSTPADQSMRVYVASRGRSQWSRWGTIHAVDAHTGTERWRVPTRGVVETPPAVAGDSLVVVTDLDSLGADGPDRTRVVCLDQRAGRERWTHDVAASPRGPPVVVDGRVYVTDGEARVHALDVDSGRSLWTRTVAGGPQSVSGAPAVADGTVYVTVPTQGRGLHALDAADGSYQWRAPEDGPGFYRGPAVVGDAVLATSHDQLVALDADAGTVRWSTGLPALSSPSHPVSDGSRAYVAGTRRVVAVDLADGQVRWRVHREDRYLGRPVVAADALLVDARDRLFAFDAATGDPRWRQAIPGVGAVAAVDGAVFAAGSGGNLYAVGQCEGVWCALPW
jgi:outer membrane protein assembly factor BamB